MLGRMNPLADLFYNGDLLIRFILCREETQCSLCLEACRSSIFKESRGSNVISTDWRFTLKKNQVHLCCVWVSLLLRERNRSVLKILLCALSPVRIETQSPLPGRLLASAFQPQSAIKCLQSRWFSQTLGDRVSAAREINTWIDPIEQERSWQLSYC